MYWLGFLCLLCIYVFVVCSDSEEDELSGSDVAEEGGTSEEDEVDRSLIIEGKRRRAPITYTFDDDEDDEDEEDDD